MITQAEAQRFSAQVTEHLFGFYLPFWCGPALDTQNGGWMAWLSNDLRPDRSQPKGLIVNSRILWAFSAAHRVRQQPQFAEMAARAFNYVMTRFWDSQYGGAFWRLNDAGAVIDDSKKIYGQAFTIYAFAEFHRAFGNITALDRAGELFELIECHAHDSRLAGYVEVCRRDWSEAGPDARLSDKDMNEKKSMNNHLHILEAYTNLHRVWPDSRVAARLRELIDIFLARILDSRTNHLHHFFDEQWNLRSDTYTFGHDIEASWLLCEAAEELNDSALLSRIRVVAVRLAESVLKEAVSKDGGIYYEGKAGTVIDPGRECWPQAEALVGFLNAFEISGDGKFFTAVLRVWDFIQDHLVDRVHGEWFWRIKPDGQPDPQLAKVSEWKGPYHASRACMEILRRLKTISAPIKNTSNT